MADRSYGVDSRGHLIAGVHCYGKSGLVEVLGWWLENSSAQTIGPIDPGKFKGRPWLRATIGGHRIHVNADTTRVAVRWMVEQMRRRPETPWRVVQNQRGRVNKVVVKGTLPSLAEILALLIFRKDPNRGWYAYTDEVLAEETIL